MKNKTIYVALIVFALTFFHSFGVLAGRPDDHITHTDSTQLVVATREGLVKGTFENNSCVWKGIRYAKAPVGDLRFRAPEPVDRWEGIRAATAFGPAAPQSDNGFIKGEPTSEDCLYLNIWSPAADGKKRPVMVWIHGGGFEVGSGSSPLYDGAHLSANGDVVVVTLNYRMGIFGFLYFGGDNPAFENNLGIRDQIAALQWVERNIAAFGGDPSQVTIFGESAGGTSVETLLACPAAKGLFSRAIAESGPASILWQPETGIAVRKKFMAFLGLPSDSLSLLKTLAADTLLAAQDKLSKYIIDQTSSKVFSPTIDGRLIVNDLFTCLSPAQSGHVALLIGTNKDESTLFASHRLQMAPNNSKDLNKELLYRFKRDDKARITSVYDGYPRKRAILNLLTDAVFRMPAVRFAECQSRLAPVYMYRFEWSPFLLNLSGLRAFHGLEIPFVFGNIDGKAGKLLHLLGSKKVIHNLSQHMQQAWLNFARYGNPNGPRQGDWQPYDEKDRATMIFDKTSKPVDDPDAAQRKAWDGVYYYY